MTKPEKCALVIVIIIGFFTSLTESVDNLPANGDLSKFFPLTLIHNNDFHARYEETNLKSKACSASDKQQNKCIAGIARLQTVIQDLRKQYASKNALYLNIGDNYQGTLWYNLLRWKVTAHFVKLLKPDAMTLGNHEFDHRPEGLRPYLKVLREAGIRTVVANLELNGEPNLKALPKSITIKVQNRWIGLIGVLYDKTHEIAMTGKVTLSNAVQAVKAEASRLKAKGIQIIVVMSHCSFEEDKKIAAQAGDDIDVIVGAHSHSFLYSRESGKPYDKGDTIEGDYPQVVNSSSSGRSIPIVQAKAFGKYVGRLTLYFDKQGEVKHWEGYPVFVDNSIKPDETILQELIPWRQKVVKLGSTEIGSTEIHLDLCYANQLESRTDPGVRRLPAQRVGPSWPKSEPVEWKRQRNAKQRARNKKANSRYGTAQEPPELWPTRFLRVGSQGLSQSENVARPNGLNEREGMNEYNNNTGQLRPTPLCE
ncbi:salivary apyrase [Culex quinquefasciatus]|uniref:Apyrase n=1 Tax=Culex quinquefasciatus TaxID=7176 RepID=B0XJ50_CULQU|nr:salivary apyrase [Culex quinquefasciatus]|eukprot:XP_001869672.1 salivary apyrase [Culex quinquefasciatus]